MKRTAFEQQFFPGMIGGRMPGGGGGPITGGGGKGLPGGGKGLPRSPMILSQTSGKGRSRRSQSWFLNSFFKATSPLHSTPALAKM